MKLGRCQAWNFGSYSHIEFDFADTGLSLVYGKTGSGKSMLADLPAWILFSITAKNGAADDVRSWQTPDEPTKGILDVQLPEGSITVTRVRGKAGQNDLYWTENNEVSKQRGKDLADTQKRLVTRLGVDSTLYLSASYFCDFSPSGQFFMAKAKDRRELFDKIALLDLPAKIAESSSDMRKTVKKELEAITLALATANGKEEHIKASFIDSTERFEAWGKKVKEEEVKFKSALDAAKKEVEIPLGVKALQRELKKANDYLSSVKGALRNIMAEHKQLSSLSADQCPTCLSPQGNNTHRRTRIDELKREIVAYKQAEQIGETEVERLADMLDKETFLEQAQKDLNSVDRENPFGPVCVKLEAELEASYLKVDKLESKVEGLECVMARLTRLYDLSFELRGELLRKAVKEIEVSTNGYLEKYFDSEIRVGFAVNGDDLDVTIQKSGFECSFRQLSKGQRQLLKLCFSVSIMQSSANSAGVHFDNVLLDEPTDGMDAELKVKAFSLFEDIAGEASSVLVIEHSAELQAMFPRKYHVTMESDVSNIELEDE